MLAWPPLVWADECQPSRTLPCVLFLHIAVSLVVTACMMNAQGLVYNCFAVGLIYTVWLNIDGGP